MAEIVGVAAGEGIMAVGTVRIVGLVVVGIVGVKVGAEVLVDVGSFVLLFEGPRE